MLSKESFMLGLFVVIVIASGFDVYYDISHGAPFQHTLKEAGIMLLAFAGAIWLLFSLRAQRAQIDELHQALEQAKDSNNCPDQYVIEARQQFCEMVRHQFETWQLTNSEKEVGWLLLKGLSLKEIAIVRNTLEKTVRQQASAIYRKADLAGRHAFSAWFIEELL